MRKELNIQFLGAAGTVTGSKYLIEWSGKRVMIDCGLFQGLKELRLLNWDRLPFNVSTLDAVILTHGHLDHVGYLPMLVKQGFRGKIYATQPTIEIAKLILLDSAKIQEEDADRANRYGYSKHHPAKPLYTTEEAEKVFPMFQGEPLDEWNDIEDVFSFRFRYNGHILGATFIELKVGNKTIVFSGDIGRPVDPLLYPPKHPQHADILFIESTYGNRIHKEDPKEQLVAAINNAAAKNGTIIIPTFAVERTQLLMFELWKLRKENRIPHLPIFMDSPMATHVLETFTNNTGWHKLSVEESRQMCKDIKLVNKPEETNKLAASTLPKIILAASGMASGGRVLTYFEHLLGKSESTVLMVGHQGKGTRGRALLDGATEIKMRGKFWTVKADIVLIEGLSAHADQQELLDWMSELITQPEQIFITHGEPEGAEALQEKIFETYQLSSVIPELNSYYSIPMNDK